MRKKSTPITRPEQRSNLKYKYGSSFSPAFACCLYAVRTDCLSRVRRSVRSYFFVDVVVKGECIMKRTIDVRKMKGVWSTINHFKVKSNDCLCPIGSKSRAKDEISSAAFHSIRENLQLFWLVSWNGHQSGSGFPKAIIVYARRYISVAAECRVPHPLSVNMSHPLASVSQFVVFKVGGFYPDKRAVPYGGSHRAVRAWTKDTLKATLSASL